MNQFLQQIKISNRFKEDPEVNHAKPLKINHHTIDNDAILANFLMKKITEKDENGSKVGETKQRTRSTKKEQERMNIIVFYGDDWRYDSIGSLNKFIKTPFLDDLAKKGMLFTQNAVTTSICWISRACFATGQHFARHKSLNRTDPVPYHSYWNETLFGKLMGNGYFTGSVGKWQPGEDIKDHMFNYSTNYEGFHFKNKRHITDMNVKDALHFLKEEFNGVDDPFALFVNFFAPHAVDDTPYQYLAQKETEILYKKTKLPFGPSATEKSWKNLPYFLDENDPGRKRWKNRFSSNIVAQTMLKKYYRLITGVDLACGKILQELERQDELENTLIIFTTDNGYYLAEHGLADKWYAHQESIRVPLIIKDPRMSKDLIGTRNDALTLSIDIAPTILKAAGISVPDRMQGDDMSKLYTGNTAIANDSWRKGYYYEYPTIPRIESIKAVQALVRKDYKYVYWPAYKYEELFDLLSDPYEENNLFNSTEEKDVKKLEELRIEFQKVQAEAQ